MSRRSKIEALDLLNLFTASMISALSPHSHTKMNSVINTPSSMSASTFCWGTDLSYEDHVSRHTPSGEWNHLVASIILDARSGRQSRRISSDSPFDSAVYGLQQSIQRGTDDEKRLLLLIQKTKEVLARALMRRRTRMIFLALLLDLPSLDLARRRARTLAGSRA
jgi:hypothetical protein